MGWRSLREEASLEPPSLFRTKAAFVLLWAFSSVAATYVRNKEQKQKQISTWCLCNYHSPERRSYRLI